MLSMQEVHSYNKLSEKGIVNSINCPFNEDGVSTHILIPFLKENEELYFTCVTCDTIFTPGLKTIETIKKSLELYSK
jgi:hypothetical protein